MSWLELDPGFIRARQPLLLAGLLLILAAAAQAQGVAINTNGAAADASAMLDISSTQRGFLPPRMTAAQRAAIVSPATGLLVYQSDGIVGLYYNAGTPAVPNWVLAGPGQGAGAGQWTVSGSNLYYTAGKIAVGTTPSGYGITLSDPNNGLRVATANTGGSLASFGGVGVFDVDAPFIPGGRLRLTESGMLGIGNTAPTAPLSFANGYGKKVSLAHVSLPLPGFSGDYGLGVVSGQTQVFGAGTGAGVGLGYDDNGTFVEKLGVRSTGALAVGGNEGTAGQVLTSGGAGAAATWSRPASQPVMTQVLSTTSVGPTDSQELDIPGLSSIFTIPPQGADVFVTFTVRAYTINGCVACNFPAFCRMYVDGSFVANAAGPIVNNDEMTLSASQLLTGLSPGIHTVKLTGRGPGGILGNSISYGSGTAASVMVLQVLPH
jgi:hypothetical protein